MSEVFLYVYDISKGLASQLSQSFLGKYIPGIWHTGIVVFGQEVYYGSNGIEWTFPSGTILGEPNEKVKLSNTEKLKAELDIYLNNLSHNIFHGSKYDLFNHNCNTFSNELSIWLTGRGIPEYITNLPLDVLNTPIGRMIIPTFNQYSTSVSDAYGAVTNVDKGNLDAIYYKESLGSEIDAFLCEEVVIANQIYFEILKSMIYSLKEDSSSYISEDFIDLIVLTNNDSMSIDAKIVVFDVLRLFITRSIESVVNLFVDPIVWIRGILQESIDEKLNDTKCKFLCNLIGIHFELISTNKEILKMIVDFGLICVRCESTIETATALIRNLVIYISVLDEEILLEISSVLLHMLSNNKIGENQITKENIVGSAYYLVKHSELVKGLAKAQDIHKRIRRETIFCQLLHRELQ